MKLYKRARKRFFRNTPKRMRQAILWAVSLKPGDIINDCSGFNRVIKDVYKQVANTRHGGWFIYDVEFDLEPFGHCSLINCGVEPAKTPEEIVRWFKLFYDNYDGSGWHYKTSEDPVWMRLSNNLPICDERGMKI